MNALHDAPNVPHRARLRVDDFLLLAEHGAFESYSKTELIEGEIFCMNAQFARHAAVKTDLAVELALRLRAIESSLRPIVEVAVTLSDTSMPEPDIVLSSFRGAGPVPLETVAMVVEVSDTTLATDLGRKAELYARAGVPEYWVVDLEESRFLLHAEPGDEGYAEQIDAPFGERLFSATIEGLAVETGGL